MKHPIAEHAIQTDYDILSGVSAEPHQPEIVVLKKKSRIARVGSAIANGVKHTIGTSSEIAEGCSIAYSTYLIFTYDNDGSPLAYIYVFGVGLANATFHVLHLKHILPEKKHHHIRTILETTLGGAVGAIFAEALLKPTPGAVGFGFSVFSILVTSKGIVEVLGKNPKLRHKMGFKIPEHIIGILFNVLLGAGGCGYVFDILEGYGVETNSIEKYTSTSIVSFLNVLADLPITKYGKFAEKNALFKIADLYRSFLFGAECGLIMNILLADLTVNIQKLLKYENPRDFTNTTFYTILAVSITHALLAMGLKFRSDLKQQNLEHGHDTSETIPLLHEDKHNGSSYSLKSLSKLCCSFWYSKEEKELHRVEEIVVEKREEKAEKSKCGFFSLPKISDWWSSKKNDSVERHAALDNDSLGFHARV